MDFATGNYLFSNRLTVGILTAVVSVCDDEVYLRALVAYQMGRLLVQILFHFFVLDLIQHSLQKFLKLVLAHYLLGHANKRGLCRLADILVRIV